MTRRASSDEADRFTVLVIGGTGVFGARICRLLAADPRLKVLVAGRDEARARALAQNLRNQFPAARLEALRLDIAEPIAPVLMSSGARLVIHTAGPFQGQDYAVARACISGRVHYLDLSDGRDFVCGIEALDTAARQAGVLAVSGVSSVPGLSSMVVAHLAQDLAEVTTIEMGITPGNRVALGPGVVAAILGYAGRPVPWWRDGRYERVYGCQDLRCRTLGLAGTPPLGPRWLTACDVPDLALFPRYFDGVRDVTFHAGLELGVLQLGLWALTWPVRWGLIGSLAPLAPLAGRVAAWLRGWGSDRGGMFVEVTGRRTDGRTARRRWTLIAERGDGPFVPCLPAVILAGALAAGRLRARGAQPCIGLLGLDDFAAAARGLDLHWGTEELYD